MPRVATEIPENYESIVRPVAIEIARQLPKLLPLPAEITILFPGSTEEAPMTGSTLGFQGESSTFGAGARLRIEVEEALVEDRVLSTAVMQKENRPIFLDDALGVKMVPIYSGTELVLNCTYRAPNRVSARKFRDDALIHTAMVREYNLHEITYHYAVPYTFLHILHYLHTLRESVAPYGEDFSEWVREHITTKATNLVNLSGQQQQLVIAEHQVCPLGFFEFAAQPEPESKDKETGPWNVNFTYRVMFDKAIGCTLQWPLIVHNQLVDEPLRGVRVPVGHSVDPSRRLRQPSLSRFAFDAMTPNLYPSDCKRKLDGISIPEYDDWVPAVVPPSTSTLLSVMTTVDPEDPHALFSLTAMGDYEIDPAVLELLRGEAPYLTRMRQSFMHIELYCEDQPMAEDQLVVTADLELRTVEPMDLRKRYHVRIALVNDLKYLLNSALERFRAGGEAALTVLNTLQWKLLGRAKQLQLLAGRYIPRQDLMDIATRLNDLKIPHHSGVEYRMLTVGNYTVLTQRRERSIDDADRRLETDSPTTEDAGASAGDTLPIPGCDG